MDEGLPVSYQVLERDVLVFASGGEVFGRVDHVVSAPEVDIFHGIVVRVDEGRRFVAADQIVSLHERGVDLRLDITACATLPEPHGAAPAYRDRDPGVKPSPWSHFLDKLGGGAPKRHDWTREG